MAHNERFHHLGHNDYFNRHHNNYSHHSYVWWDYDWFHSGVGLWSFGFGYHGSWNLHFGFGHHYGSRYYSHYYSPSYWWYGDYCDWYYGSWYRPYVNVTRTIYRPSAYSDQVYYSDDDSYSYSVEGEYGNLFADDYEAIEAEPYDELPDVGQAWELFTDGYLQEAAEAFDAIARAYPFDGLPLVGKALSLGLLSDDAEAVRAMRQALRIDATSIDGVPTNLSIQGHVERLLDRYVQEARSSTADADLSFMIAALRSLADQDAIAFFTIDEAIKAGDNDVSTLNLQESVRRRMYESLGRGN